MSDAARLRDNSVQVEAMRRATTGKRRPVYVIEAMQAGRLANPIGEATRQRMSAAAKARGCQISPEGRARIVAATQAKGRFRDHQKAQMAAMRDAGASLKQIGLAFDIRAESSVYATIKAWRERQAAA